ncbi:hypothetical protein [Streptomyces sp. NPDC057002]|uniref:hypothetical protein n=1 Tax=Streptomyces sp. NPDC057002 TaxID=3345992 RepID=UPI00363671F3
MVRELGDGRREVAVNNLGLALEGANLRALTLLLRRHGKVACARTLALRIADGSNGRRLAAALKVRGLWLHTATGGRPTVSLCCHGPQRVVGVREFTVTDEVGTTKVRYVVRAVVTEHAPHELPLVEGLFRFDDEEAARSLPGGDHAGNRSGSVWPRPLPWSPPWCGSFSTRWPVPRSTSPPTAWSSGAAPDCAGSCVGAPRLSPAP